MMTTHKDTKPAVLTAAKQDSTTSVNQDGSAAYMHDTTGNNATIDENGASCAHR